MTTTTTTTTALHGVHHTARPTWKLRETVQFYRDKLGLPLVHAVSARGWGREGHPDFLHFFFDSGQGSTIAFFYYLGTGRPDWLTPRREDHNYRATHTAWHARDRAELEAWAARLTAQGIDHYSTKHEVIESVYFQDPNGYGIEITLATRPFCAADAQDAQRSLEAAMALEDEAGGVEHLGAIDSIWQRKAAAQPAASDGAAGPRVYVLDVPEFRCLVDDAQSRPDCRVDKVSAAYWCISAEGELRFSRQRLGVKPAVWYGLFTGGLAGRIAEFGRDDITISAA
jgi:catechol 2,3-dioxygenase-like lactoylglutathione lyase family enzyme